MNENYLLRLFRACLGAEYITVEDEGSFALYRVGGTLYVFFEKSNGAVDWYNNLDFAAVSHARGESGGGRSVYPVSQDDFLCHGGFLRVWNSILPYIEGALLDLNFENIITVGYSHGAALALLCHEYVWYHRRDLRGRAHSYGFGCPRVIYGRAPRENERWQDFFVIRNIDDLVTHLPPRAFGFRQVGRLIEIGKRGRWSRLDAHREENYILSLNSLSDEALTDLTKQYF